jgi:prohibitin 1
VVVIGNSETGLPLILDTSSKGIDLKPADLAQDPVQTPARTVIDTTEMGDGEIITKRLNPSMSEGHIETGDLTGKSVFDPVDEVDNAATPEAESPELLMKKP